ncbi:MAG: hypothetical protein K9G33_04480 [Sneathiella sp.]|nr:hypothetical protein [Sneathiella sp.]
MSDLTSKSKLPSTVFHMSECPAGGSLVFFPDFGGNVLYAKPIVQKLSRDINCYGIRLSTDMVKDLESLSLVDIAFRFAEDISKEKLPEPIYVCGFSFAGYFAFETAIWLSMNHATMANLLILDTAIRPKSLFVRLAQSPILELLYAVRYLSKNWRSLLFKEKSTILHKYGQINFDLGQHPEAYQYIIRHMYRLLSKYKPRHWDVGSAIVLKAKRNHGVWHYSKGDLGWNRFVNGKIMTISVPGDHLSMLRDPDNAAVLTSTLREILGINKKGTDNAQLT